MILQEGEQRFQLCYDRLHAYAVGQRRSAAIEPDAVHAHGVGSCNVRGQRIPDHQASIGRSVERFQHALKKCGVGLDDPHRFRDKHVRKQVCKF